MSLNKFLFFSAEKTKTEEMNNSTLNFSTHEESTNSTIITVGLSRWDMFESSLFCFNLLLVFPTHSYVVWLIITGTGSGVASEFFILNLSVCETAYSLSAIFNLLSFFFSKLMIRRHFFQGFAITGRPVFQCLICVERYLAVVHPVTFLKYKPLRYRVICCTAAWIIILGSCLLSMFISENITEHTWFLSTQFLFFLSIQLFCLVAVLRALKQSGPGERGREREEENHMKRRAFYLILIITVSMSIIYEPYIIIGFSFILTQHFIKELFSFSFICYILAGFVQPVLYLRRVGKLFCLRSP